MTQRIGLTRDQLELSNEPRMPAAPVLTPKRKGDNGRGFKTNNPENRFWIVNPMQNQKGVREAHPSYARFNECKLPPIVSRIPVRLGGHDIDQVCQYSRGLYRWDTKSVGPPPSEYSAPPSQSAWCSTIGSPQDGVTATAKRWNGKEFKTIACGGSKCPFTANMGPDDRSPCIKGTSIWMIPEWRALADLIRVSPDPNVVAYKESIDNLPTAALKLHTGGQYAPSTENWDTLIRWVQGQAADFGLDQLSLLGLPMWLGVGKRSGRRQYTVYTFEMRGRVDEWLSEQAQWMKSISDRREYLIIPGPHNPQEQLPAVTSADMIEVTDLVIPPQESRPRTVALLPPKQAGPVNETVVPAKTDKPKAATVKPETEPPAAVMSPGKLRLFRDLWSHTGHPIDVLEQWCREKYAMTLAELPPTTESDVLLHITRVTQAKS